MPTNRRIMAGMLVAFFAHLACYPQAYTSGTYDTLAELAPLRTWGIVLATAGAVMAITRGVGPVILVGALLTGWLFGLIGAVLTGTTQSPAGAVFIGGYVLLLIVNAGRTVDPTTTRT